MSNYDRDEVSNEFYIPNNYTDSGRVINGMFKLRNVIEALIIGYVMYKLLIALLPIDTMRTKIITTFAITIPITVLALIGFQGDSITQTIGSIFRFVRDRKQLRFRRIKRMDKKKDLVNNRVKAKNKKNKKTKGKKKVTNKKSDKNIKIDPVSKEGRKSLFRKGKNKEKDKNVRNANKDRKDQQGISLNDLKKQKQKNFFKKSR